MAPRRADAGPPDTGLAAGAKPGAGPGGAPSPDERRAAGRRKVGELSISLFLAATLLFLPPLLTLLEGGGDLFGLPVVYLFLFAVWSLVVGAVYVIAEVVGR